MSRRYRWPVIAGVAGIILCALASWTFIQGFGGWHTSFQGPGTVTVEIPEAGDYRLWHESKTIIDGRLQVVDDELPAGTVIEFKNAGGTTVPLKSIGGSMSQEIGNARRVAVGRVEIPEAGTYMANIAGFADPRKFRLSEIRFLEHFLRALLFALPGMLLAITGLVWAIVISTRRR
ncbi:MULTISPECIES: hypothetical protein [unclassified Wenzhouxiangella]|uniref:hypothetical protein n=1 Tax=unclassified Wenzhouxiangella TaxID=2613841 RepID=UPI000E327B45|nr:MULTISPECIES: hypothetical protein [unclassified Wenzhouxiangella]RFF26991.1 hypothetical protein DZK25_10340 [Wenzhouxiangella sp. 15181]RFP69503.1 hypothetical protein DZK26_03830 [Wenzhouxiangella sp. 15190]